MGEWKEGKVIEPGSVFVPFVMEPEMEPEEREWMENGVIHLFCIGKYETRKNQRMLVEVIEELAKEYELHLTIAGECSSEAHRAYYDGLVQYITEHGLQNKVTLLKNLSRQQVGEQYRKADLFVIPSTKEPASISQLEAMAYSLPVICGNKNGTACYVENGINGWQFLDNDKASLAGTVGKTVSDPEKMKQMGRESYRLILEKYQIGSYIEGIEKLMNMLQAD